MASAPLSEGDYLLHYKLLNPIGAGGMGVVWRALDTRLNREVALKLLPYLTADGPQQAQRLTREAQCASALNHPNIVTIYDINSAAGHDFIVMELVRGKSLRDILHERRMGRTEALRHAVALCDALAKAHAAGIIHRDLKPANVMITNDGLLKVLDFGLAKPVSETPVPATGDNTDTSDPASLTVPGAVLGTVGYMSPEQTLGGSVDMRADVFSFGVVLYEMLSGYRPFPGATRQEVAANLLRSTPQPIALLCPGLPHPIEEIVNRCLANDPAERYADCGEVLRDLRSAVESLPLTWSSTGESTGDTTIFDAALGALPSRVAGPPARRHARLWLSLGSAAALVVLVAAAWLAWKFYPRPAVQVHQRGIAVLPFTAVDNQDKTRAFGVGLVMSLSSQLSALQPFREAFWVVPPSDVMQAKAQSARDARQMFGVDLVVTGSVETTGKRIRVTAIVSDARSQRTVRSAQMTDAAGDSFALQDNLVALVADLLQVTLPVDARLTASSGKSHEPGAEDYYLQGRGYLLSDINQTDLAIDVFKEALRRDPAFARAHAGLGEAYLDKYEFTHDPEWIARAQESCERALKLRDGTTEARTVLGNIARLQGRYDEAASILRDVVTREPRNWEAWIRLARSYEAKRSLQEAETAYRQALELQPSYPGSYQHIGTFYYNQGRYDEAIHSFLRASALAPDNYKALNNLAAVYLQQGRFDLTEKTLRRSLQLRPNPIAYNNLASLYFDQGRYAEAVPMMEQAVQMGQKNVTLLGSLAHLYRLVPELQPKAGKASQDAIDIARKQLAVNPHDTLARAELAWLYADRGNKPDARREMAAALKEGPKDGAVLFRSVLVHELVGDRDGALAAYNALAKTGSYLTEVNGRPELRALRTDPRFREQKWQTTR